MQLSAQAQSIGRFQDIKTPLVPTYSGWIYYIVCFSVFIGCLLGLGQLLGLNLGEAASANKYRFIIVAVYYLFVQLGMVFLFGNKTLAGKNKAPWFLFVFTSIIFLNLLILFRGSAKEAFHFYLSIMGLSALVFLHNINISDKYLAKYIKLILKIFYIVLIFCAVQQVLMLAGYGNVVFHEGRINGIFQDYNSLSGYLLSVIPVLWILKKKKLVLLSILLIALSKSTTSLLILVMFAFLYGFSRIKKKKQALRIVGLFLIVTCGVAVWLNSYSVEFFGTDPDSAIGKIRQLFYLLNVDTLSLVARQIGNEDLSTMVGIDGSAFTRVVQFFYATFGWNSLPELFFGFRPGGAEGFFLFILIKFGLVGFAFYFYVCHKYYILRTHSKNWRLYFWAFFIGMGFALPLISYQISMFIVSLQIYVFQRLLQKNNRESLQLD